MCGTLFFYKFVLCSVFLMLCFMHLKLQDGSCHVALGSLGNGDIVTVLPNEVEVIRPKKSDRIKILNGNFRTSTGKLIGIDGSDGIVKLDDTYEVKILDMVILAKLAT
jgi:transcription elongation factor SPT5